MAQNTVKIGNKVYQVTDNILRNLVFRDAAAVTKSFDDQYGSELDEIDAFYSEASFMFFVATRTDLGLHKDYKTIFPGLLHNALNTFGGAVVLLRQGLPAQSMLLIRQVLEICSTIIHISTDPKDEAIKDFHAEKFQSSKSIGPATRVVPIMGVLWGGLSEDFVHINSTHSRPRPVLPYQAADSDVDAVLTCLRMAIWICDITAELAFSQAKNENRYWKQGMLNGREALKYDPDEKERIRIAKFLNIEGIGPDDLRGGDAE
jgi:hypothetical protein